MPYRLLSYFVAALLTTASFTTKATKSSAPLFAEDAPLDAVLSSPLSTLFKERKQDVRLYQDGKFTYSNGDHEATPLSVKVRTRGNFRRMNCTNPPLMLNFRKKEVKDTLLTGQDKLKLVSPCRRTDYYQNLVALEYIAYEIFAVVSERHFETRLINLGMIDTDGANEPWKTLGFVIEDVSEMASRVGMEHADIEKGLRAQLDHEHTAIVEMFQLFIANTDYSTLVGPPGDKCCHNVRLIRETGDNSPLYPIPYDFDSSGFINARYWKPSGNYPVNRATQRYFTGWCKEEHYFRNAISVFLEKKPDIYATVQNSDLLDAKTIKSKVRFIDLFYDVIEDERKLQRQVLDRCRGDVVRPAV